MTNESKPSDQGAETRRCQPCRICGVDGVCVLVGPYDDEREMEAFRAMGWYEGL